MPHPSEGARLNPAQHDAVEHGDGPLLVLAGAGSGKTRVITHRIARLVERGVPPGGIVALTFTNKAAGEMRERVGKMVGGAAAGSGRGGSSAANSLTVCTFHAFGLAVLTAEREALGGRFAIFDQGDQTSLVKQLLRDAGADRSYDAQAVLARISNAKNAFVEAADLVPAEGDEYDEITKIVMPKYQAALKQYRAFDFDDLVCEVARLWRDRADVRARWQARYLHVLVDEYQDTNRAQLEMLRLLVGPRKNVCAVGDDDQAIYGWRGADVKNILDFERHFPGARVVKLEQNYRSKQPILAVANAVIAKRADAKWRKVLYSDRLGGGPPEHVIAPLPEVEAGWVGREIRRLLREEHRAPSSIAVLYRSNGQSKAIEEALREQGAPYRVVGGMQFFERKEVKDVLAYLKVALNTHDEISLRRIINYPARGIGDVALEKLATHAYARGWTLWEAVTRVDALDDLPGPAREGCRALERVIDEARRGVVSEKKRSSDVTRAIIESVGLRAEIDAHAPSVDVGAKRWASVESILGTLARRDDREGAGLQGLAAFLQLLTLDIRNDSEDPGEAVTLSTLHGSKGLEFDVVFLIGCEEGYLPHSRTLDTRATDVKAIDTHSADIEEERRLFYVGVTRARERLILSRAKSRVLRGKPTPRTPSRFLLDVPPELLSEREISYDAANAPISAREAADNAGAILAMLQGAKKR